MKKYFFILFIYFIFIIKTIYGEQNYFSSEDNSVQCEYEPYLSLLTVTNNGNSKIICKGFGPTYCINKYSNFSCSTEQTNGTIKCSTKDQIQCTSKVIECSVDDQISCSVNITNNSTLPPFTSTTTSTTSTTPIPPIIISTTGGSYSTSTGVIQTPSVNTTNPTLNDKEYSSISPKVIINISLMITLIIVILL